MKINSERIYLRELTESDFDALYAVLADSDIMQHYPYAFDEARVRNWIARNIERYETFGFGLWAVCLRSTDEMIGDCGISMQNINGVIRPEVGYHIRKDHQRKGYASEAARAAINWIFSNTCFNYIYSYMKKSNIPSSSCAKSLGLSFVADFTDGEGEISSYYKISRDEWESR